LTVLFAAALLLFGCRRRDTVPVSGTVTFAGQAVSNGQILFISADRSTGPTASQIENGAYHLQCKPGPKRIEIRAAREVRRVPGALGPEYQDYIPAEFNKKSTLTAEVTQDGPNHFDFNLP
jgi:hypothetical protein